MTETDCTIAGVKVKPKNRYNYHSDWNHTHIILNAFMMGLLLPLVGSNTVNLLNITWKDADTEEGYLQNLSMLY